MNKIKGIFTCMLLCISLQHAQSQSAIYISAADLENNKPTLIDQGHNIHLHSFFGESPRLTLTHEGKKTSYQKKDLYGYRNDKNEVYRFYKNVAYEIVEAGNIYIYGRKRNIAQSKGYVLVTDHYFSDGAEGKILPLTIGNLALVYKDNEGFQDLLQTYFPDGNAARYDAIHKTYMVNYLYSRTLNKHQTR